MKLGFIGLGNMASAMIGGILKQQAASAEDIIGKALTEATENKIKERFNIQIGESNAQVAARADILFLAVKPIFFPEVIAEIKDAVRPGTL
ncbi:MAG: NAD(P)-binding domain-containing protein, partial [Acetatifactor sp.]|nr:NAD(P)-binding domain-containing protein [Acetatifactor sp.]